MTSQKVLQVAHTIKVTKDFESFDRGSYVIVQTIRIGNTVFQFGGWSSEGLHRVEFGGPMVAGPQAYAFPKCAVICSNPEMGSGAESQRNRKAGLETDANFGDLVEIDSVVYRLESACNNNVELVKI
jgi:hypothetical protein